MLDPKIKATMIIVSADFTKEPGVLIVGRERKDKTIKIINAYTDDEAKELWEKLVNWEDK